MAETIPEANRSLGIWLIVGGAVAGGLSAFLFWLSTQTEDKIGPIAFGSITALLAVYLIGYGIKKIVAASAMS